MIKLDSTYLPTETEPERKAGPGIALQWHQPYKTAPGVKLDVLAKYSTGSGALGLTIATTNPDRVGRYFQVDTGMTVYDIASLSWSGGSFTPIDDPLEAEIGNCWGADTEVGILTPDAAIASQSLSITMTGKFILPFYDEDYNYTIALPANFTVTGVEVASLTFTQAGVTPRTGNWRQTGASLKLYGSSSAYKPEPFSDLYVTGVRTVTAPSSPTLAIAVFDLLDSGISIVDAMDYIGLSFIPAQNAYEPVSGDFFWHRPLLTIFADMQHAGSLTPAPVNRNYQKTIGSFSYYGIP